MTAAKFIGLMFRADPGESIAEVTRDAVQVYHDRYGAPPEVCQVHPGEDVGDVGVVVEYSQFILPAHVLVGRREP